MNRLSEGESTMLGGVAAFIGGVMLQPTLYWKNARQQGMPFTLSPLVVYRGMAASMFSEVGSMAIQFGLTGLFNNIVLQGQDRPLTTSEELTSAFGGGAVAAFFTSPVELIMIQQQKHGKGIVSTVRSVLTRHGIGWAGIYRGILPAMLRDSIYVGGMLGVTPVVQSYLMRTTDWGITGTGFAASLIGGAFAGGVSAPMDTIKTCMQGDMRQKNNRGFVSTVRTIREQGAKRFFNGGTWRIINITGTVLVANECRNRLPPLLFPGKFSAGPDGVY